MNWFKAKNLILVSLLIMNIISIVLIYGTSDTYILTNERIETTYQVLSSKYNIGIYAQFPKKYKPMKEIKVVNQGVNVSSYLHDMFFDEIENVNIINEEDKFIYQNLDKTLMIQDGDFALSTTNGIELSKSDILLEFQENIGNFLLYDQYEANGLTIYDYRENFEDQTIYTNYIIIEEKDGVIYNVEGYYAKPIGFIDNKREIIPVDMALYNFANFYPRTENQEIIIDEIDLVYNQEQFISEPDVELKATPCYLIKVRGNNIPVKIDAYTNTILTK